MLLLVAALLQSPVTDSAALRHADGRVPPAVTAVRIARPPVLDGRLDDPAWALAPPITDLRQSDPDEGKAVTESTEVRVIYDDEAVYIGARLFDREPAKIERHLGRRDAFTQSDDFRVLFDSYHDHRTAFRFDANPVGVKHDLTFGDDGNFSDDSWDPVWDVATSVDSLGWTAEYRIPFSQLRFSGAREQVWGVRFVRWIQRKNEFSFFPFLWKTESGFVSRFAHLVGLRDIPAPKRLELLPYTVARGTYHQPDVAGDPFDRSSSYFGGAGLDLKYGVTSGLTLDAAINPDFGQVEIDPAFVNLTAFEQFLQERRPFFIEGANIFNFGGTGPFLGFGGTPRMFYSRRIGRPPSGSPNGRGGFADVPDNTTILGAAKLTGKTGGGGGWSVGVLDAVTAEERAVVDSSGIRFHDDVEPLTNYFVGRLKREYRGRAGLGFLGTAVSRRIDDARLDFLRTGAYLGATDFYYRWHGNTYVLTASLGASLITGDTLAINAAQRASSRYYQRPDAAYLRYDPTRTSLTGATGDLTVSKEAGSTNWALGFSTTTPGFEVNDLGFQRRVDRISGGWFLGHRWTRPGKVFRQATAWLSGGPSWNWGGDLIQQSAGVGGFGQLRNFWGANFSVSHQAGALDDRLTRGGPVARLPASWNLGAFVFSDTRQRITFQSFVQYTRNGRGGRSLSVSPEVSVRPSSAISFSVGPNYSVGRDAAQFLTPQGDPLATATYGSRYLFGELDQHALDMSLRLNVTFTPTLSFQLYSQPFTFAGDYQALKELRAPRTFDFIVYGRDNGSTISYDARSRLYTIDPDGTGPASAFTLGNPDFRFRSLRANAVLRWEYRPGSTVYVVWTQSRSGSFPDPSFDVNRDLGSELLRDRPTNVLLVKINYWLNR